MEEDEEEEEEEDLPSQEFRVECVKLLLELDETTDAASEVCCSCDVYCSCSFCSCNAFCCSCDAFWYFDARGSSLPFPAIRFL